MVNDTSEALTVKQVGPSKELGAFDLSDGAYCAIGAGGWGVSWPAGTLTGMSELGEGEVRELGPEDTGRWLVTTARGSRHVWDLDAWTYQRLPHADASFSAPQDGQVLSITRVERWPAVGGTSLVWFDDLDAPNLLEHWRMSNVIVSIQRYPDVQP